MKFVLLPGLDGTGLLFEAVLPELKEIDLICLPLPQQGPQDFSSLADKIEQQLPDDDFILIAESFSGGIAAALSRKNLPQLKGIIFIACFLSSPKRLIAFIASLLPIKLLAQSPFSKNLYRWLVHGSQASDDVINNSREVIKTVPNNILKARLLEISKLKYSGFTSSIPAVYIGATQDKLIPTKKRNEFKLAYSDITFKKINGPHFVLQSNPKEAASVILDAAYHLQNRIFNTAKQSTL